MAMQTGKSKVFSQLGARFTKAHNAVKGKEVEVNQTLPKDVTGVAELTDCHFGVYKDGDMKGQPYFMAAGVVHEPEYSGNVKVKGLRTQIGPEPLCDTPNRGGEKSRKTFEDHFAWFRNELLKLGLNIDQISGTPEQCEAGIIAAMNQLAKSRTFFQFRTWAGAKQEVENRGGKFYVVAGNKLLGGPYPTMEAAKRIYPFIDREPMVNHQWNGKVDFIPTANQAQAVQEEPVPAASANSESTPTTKEEPVAEGSNFSEFPEDQSSSQVEGGEDSGDDWDSIVQLADAHDGDAQAKITGLGEGILTDAEMDELSNQANDWGEMLNLIRDAVEAKQEEEKPATKPAAKPDKKDTSPKVDGVYHFKPLNPKTGKPYTDLRTKEDKPAIEVVVTEVDKKAKTVEIKETKGEKLWKNVPWTSLIDVPF